MVDRQNWLDAAHPARVDRVARVQVAGFDLNCPQHIPRRLTRAEWEVEAAG